MFRRLASIIALLALVTSPAKAIGPGDLGGQVDFWFNGSEADYDDYYGSFESGLFFDQDYFQVYCVDWAHTIGHDIQGVNYTDAFSVFVSPLSGSLSNTHDHNGVGVAGYLNAARIASLVGPGEYNSANFDGRTMLQWQQSIWWAMGFGSWGIAGDLANYEYFRDKAIDLGVVVYANQWLVITGDNKQELIYYDPDRPQEVVPEPATMTLLATGLAGMAAARRRKKRA